MIMIKRKQSSQNLPKKANDQSEDMLRIFNLRQPTNLTGRFPSTVALHAKVEELAVCTETQQPLKQVPNLMQPLSLLPDWR